jgi:hypothetical protein
MTMLGLFYDFGKPDDVRSKERRRALLFTLATFGVVFCAAIVVTAQI